MAIKHSDKRMKRHPLVLHIYGQEESHDGVLVLGNKGALIALQEMLALILEGKDESSTAQFFTADGEGYLLTVEQNDTDWQSESWQSIELPYHQYSPSTRGGVYRLRGVER